MDSCGVGAGAAVDQVACARRLPLRRRDPTKGRCKA